MISPITAEQLYLILPFKVSQLAVLLARENGSSTSEALRDIYRSNTYRQLENEGTKLWHLGPVALLEHYNQYR